MKKSHLFVGAAAFAVAMSVSQPVFAQAAADCADTDSNGVCDSEESTAIVVTGSRIARPDFESTVPVVSITGAELAQQGGVSIGDALNDLPSLRSTFSQANSTRFLGTAGLNLLDLRGLGTQRTLVLVNGRRHVGSDILVNAVSPDVNTFPTDLIERVDVVTGGNSAVYGSDAIAGVVNFILNDDFQGVQLDTTDEIIGCTYVLASLDEHEAAALTEGEPDDDALERRARHFEDRRYEEFALNLVLAREGVPVGLGPRCFVVTDATRPLYESAHRLPLGRMPGALLRIAVDDPRWLSHLSPGMIWDSYVFDEEATVLF